MFLWQHVFVLDSQKRSFDRQRLKGEQTQQKGEEAQSQTRERSRSPAPPYLDENKELEPSPSPLDPPYIPRSPTHSEEEDSDQIGSPDSDIIMRPDVGGPGIVTSTKSKTESIRASFSCLSESSYVPEPAQLKRHESQWNVMSGYFKSMTLKDEQLDEMWTSVKAKRKKRKRRRANPNKRVTPGNPLGEDPLDDFLMDDELLEIVEKYLKMCQRQAKIEFQKQSNAINKVISTVKSTVTPPARASPLVRTDPGLTMLDPMDFEQQAKNINLEDVLLDDTLHDKTTTMNHELHDRVRKKVNLDRHYGREDMGQASLRKLVGHVMMSCNQILWVINNTPEKVLRDVKQKLMNANVIRRSRHSDEPRRSFLSPGITKAMFFQNINGVLGELYEEVGMLGVRDAAPQTPKVVPKKPIPKLLGGNVQITLFCLTPAEWAIPYEMQMKIAERTYLGAITQFVLQRYGKPPKTLKWREELKSIVILPDGTREPFPADAFEEIEDGSIIYISFAADDSLLA